MTLDTFGNPMRRKILSLLSENGEMTPSQLSQYFEFTNAALARHLKKLFDNELISYRRDQNTLYYSINNKGIQNLQQGISDTLGDNFEVQIKRKKNSVTYKDQTKRKGQ